MKHEVWAPGGGDSSCATKDAWRNSTAPPPAHLTQRAPNTHRASLSSVAVRPQPTAIVTPLAHAALVARPLLSPHELEASPSLA